MTNETTPTPYVTEPRKLSLNELLSGLEIRDAATIVCQDSYDEPEVTYQIMAEAMDGTEAGEVIGITIQVSAELYRRLVLDYPNDGRPKTAAQIQVMERIAMIDSGSGD